MDSSLVRLDTGPTGRCCANGPLDDPRLSLRHLAWSQDQEKTKPYLGVAIQAEHDTATARSAAPFWPSPMVIN